jgi:hypothetical protein
MTILGFHQNPFGEVHSLMELRHFLPQRVHLGQQLGILRRLHLAAQTVR